MVGRPPGGLVRRAWRAGARGPASSGVRGGVGEDGGAGEVAAVAGEGGLTLNCKEQDRPQGPEVGWRAGRVASELFGGEERGGAGVGPGGGAEGGQADAGQAGPAVGGDQDAAWAQVEVGQAGGVGRLEGVEQLEAQLGHPADRERAVPGDQLVQGEGVEQLGDHVDARRPRRPRPPAGSGRDGRWPPRSAPRPRPGPRDPPARPHQVPTRLGTGPPRPRAGGRPARWPARSGRAGRGGGGCAASSGLRRAARWRPVTWWRGNDTTKCGLAQNRP